MCYFIFFSVRSLWPARGRVHQSRLPAVRTRPLALRRTHHQLHSPCFLRHNPFFPFFPPSFFLVRSHCSCILRFSACLTCPCRRLFLSLVLSISGRAQSGLSRPPQALACQIRHGYVKPHHRPPSSSVSTTRETVSCGPLHSPHLEDVGPSGLSQWSWPRPVMACLSSGVHQRRLRSAHFAVSHSRLSVDILASVIQIEETNTVSFVSYH